MALSLWVYSPFHFSTESGISVVSLTYFHAQVISNHSYLQPYAWCSQSLTGGRGRILTWPILEGSIEYANDVKLAISGFTRAAELSFWSFSSNILASWSARHPESSSD